MPRAKISSVAIEVKMLHSWEFIEGSFLKGFFAFDILVGDLIPRVRIFNGVTKA